MLLATILLAAGVGSAAETDALAQMRAGKALCANPDEATRTCTSIDAFAPAADDIFIDTGEVLISTNQALTLEISSKVRVENGAICGVMEMADVRNGTVRVNGALLPPARNAQAIEKIALQLKPLVGRRVCETLRIENGRLFKYGQVAGVDRNPPGKPVKWVRLDEAYKVAPR